MTKYSDKIPESDVENIIEGTDTVEQVAEKNNVPISAVNNKKTRTVEKKKLKVGFDGKDADQSLPNNSKISADETQQTSKTIVNDVPADATEALKGFWSLVDMGLKMTGFLTKGQIEYTPLEQKDIDGLAQISNNNETMRKIATFEGADMLMILGYAGMKFAPRIKIKKPEHDEEKSKKLECKCDKCKEEMKKKIEELRKGKSTVEKKIAETIKETDGTKATEENGVEFLPRKEKIVSHQDKAYQEFIQRNLGSDPIDLAAADKHMQKMKEITDGRPRIAQ